MTALKLKMHATDAHDEKSSVISVMKEEKRMEEKKKMVGDREEKNRELGWKMFKLGQKNLEVSQKIFELG